MIRYMGRSAEERAARRELKAELQRQQMEEQMELQRVLDEKFMKEAIRQTKRWIDYPSCLKSLPDLQMLTESKMSSSQ